MNTADLLIEIGTEELPTQAVENLSPAFANNLLSLLDKAQINYQEHHVFATPRRFALLIKNVGEFTPEKIIEHRGPPVSAAFKEDGSLTPAAQGFAQRFNVEAKALTQIQTEKGDYLIYKQKLSAEATRTLLLNLIEQALENLPIKKPMAWGNNTFKFVRPVHWVLVLFDNQVVSGTLFNQTIGHLSMGHRFLNNHPIAIDKAEHYAKILFEQGFVVANFDARKSLIKDKIIAIGQAHQLMPVLDEDLLNEVTCLVEWPIALLGRFDQKFLHLPHEVISCALKQHQKIFVLVNDQQKLQAFFITIANIESKDPAQVISGNEKVVHARLSDAAFFFAQDKKIALEQHLSKLAHVVFQQGLGSLLDKSQRISALAQHLAPGFNLDQKLMAHAGLLCKADLTSNMVSEFPELQGIMGAYYAEHEHQDPVIVHAIREHYQPQGASDSTPSTLAGALISICDKLDTVCGIFALGKKPSGDKDPFALKRAMIGVLRIIIEKKLALNLKSALLFSLKQQPANTNSDPVLSEILLFTWDRFENLLRDEGLPSDLLNCVRNINTPAPYDMYLRICALKVFMTKPEAASLASAHKRINNLLSKQTSLESLVLKNEFLVEEQEKELAWTLNSLQSDITSLCKQQDYAQALLRLAELKPTLDAFFDKVLVMSEDQDLKQNRLALLRDLSQLFLHVADFSHLPVGV